MVLQKVNNQLWLAFIYSMCDNTIICIDRFKKKKKKRTIHKRKWDKPDFTKIKNVSSSKHTTKKMKSQRLGENIHKSSI